MTVDEVDERPKLSITESSLLINKMDVEAQKKKKKKLFKLKIPPKPKPKLFKMKKKGASSSCSSEIKEKKFLFKYNPTLKQRRARDENLRKMNQKASYYYYDKGAIVLPLKVNMTAISDQDVLDIRKGATSLSGIKNKTTTSLPFELFEKGVSPTLFEKWKARGDFARGFKVRLPSQSQTQTNKGASSSSSAIGKCLGMVKINKERGPCEYSRIKEMIITPV